VYRVNGKRVEVSLKRWVTPDQWNPIKGKVKGNLEKARTINSFFDIVKWDFQKFYNGMYSNGENINAEELKNL
jgi:hypothetical protein